MVRLFLLSLLYSFIIFNSVGQTAPAKKTTTPKTRTAAQKSKPQPVKKKVEPVKTDRLYQLDGVTSIRGKVVKVTDDTVSYYPAATPKVIRRIPTSKLTKIVYANGVTKIIEPKEAEEIVQEVKEEVVAVKEEQKPVEEKVAAPLPDEIVLKSGEVIQGRISSQQKFKIGYRPMTSPDTGQELFVPTTKIWKLRYASTGQELVLNPVKENAGKTKGGTVASKKEKLVKEKPSEPVRTESSSGGSERIYRPFKVDITMGYSRLTDGDADIRFGFNFSVEPKYNITDHLAAGLKIEAAGFVFASSDGDEGGVLLMRSYSLTGEYLLGTKKVRPYFGMAVGLYQPLGYSYDEDDEIYKTHLDSKIGFAPRVGIHLGHFRLGAEFNIVKDNNLDVNYGHLSIKAGATIGGGKKRKR